MEIILLPKKASLLILYYFIYFYEGILIRKGTGNNLFDFGHFFQLPFSEKFEIEKKIISEIKNITNPVQKKIYQVII